MRTPRKIHPSDVTVREMMSSDVPALWAILKESPEASTWSQTSLLESIPSPTAWVAAQEEYPVGFLMGREITGEFEILNLAVAQSFRRRGIATQLLGRMVAWLQSAGTQRAYLEVRASNEAAIALYARHGFQACGSRVHYYHDPDEDAVVLGWDVCATSPKLS